MAAGPAAQEQKGTIEMADDIKIVTEEAEPQNVAEEMARSISKMYEDRDKKAINAKTHLIEQLKVTSDKYRTANGVMAAMETVRQVFGEQAQELTLDEEIGISKTVATEIAELCQDMACKAEELDPDQMDELCNDFYDKEFSQNDASAIEMVGELMALNLCQNVGPEAEDISGFCKHTDEEIEKARKDLIEYCDDNDINFNELCGPHEDCHDCLCYECVKDCKEDRQIQDGQSAYDVCDNFEKKE